MSQSSHSDPARDVPAPAGSRWVFQAGVTLALLGLVLTVVGLLFPDGLRRTAYGHLIGFAFIRTVVLGATLLVALQHLTKAIWSVVVRRVMEMFSAQIWLVALLFIPVMAIAWVGHGTGMFPWLDHDYVATNHVLHGKEAYLNLHFFTLRAVGYFAIWLFFARFFVRRSLRQDAQAGQTSLTHSMRRLSAPFVILFAGTITFAGIDWLMSLEPLWFSTMFGVYLFAGAMVSALAAVTLTSIKLMDSGRMGRDLINHNHIYNLGTLLFAFTVFWGYIAFSQYMLIWYANMPEESFYIVQRVSGGWVDVSVALALARFVLPFLALLSRRAKTDRRRLVMISAFILFGQILDLYWLVGPQLHKAGPVIGPQEIGPVMMYIGLMLLSLELRSQGGPGAGPHEAEEHDRRHDAPAHRRGLLALPHRRRGQHPPPGRRRGLQVHPRQERPGLHPRRHPDLHRQGRKGRALPPGHALQPRRLRHGRHRRLQGQGALLHEEDPAALFRL